MQLQKPLEVDTKRVLQGRCRECHGVCYREPQGVSRGLQGLTGKCDVETQGVLQGRRSALSEEAQPVGRCSFQQPR